MMMPSSAMMSFTSASMGLPLNQQSLLFQGPSSNADPCTEKHQSQNKNELPMSATSDSQPTVPSGFSSIPKKPMRPLTGYHIFFQIEREYIIQTTPGRDADESIHDNKVYLDDVPQRYRNIKLLPDWYAGPGKRQKRKHRKQHGKIGFLELSRVISTRWAQLEESDPETKHFVQKIAKAELDVYYQEMKEYKELTKDLMPAAAKPASRSTISKKNTKKRISSGNDVSHPYMPMQQSHITMDRQPRPEMVFSSHQPLNSITGSSQLKRNIDHFLSCICDNTKHLLPAVPFGNENTMGKTTKHQEFHPSLFGTREYQMQRKREVHHSQDSNMSVSQFNSVMNMSGFAGEPGKKQYRNPNNSTSHVNMSCVSPASDEVGICNGEISQFNPFMGASGLVGERPGKRVPNNTSSSHHMNACVSPAAVEVDICDEEILRLWRTSHD